MKFLIPIAVLLLSTTHGMYVQRNPYYQYANSRQARNEPSSTVIKSLGDFFRRMHAVTNKRCAYLLDEACNNGGIPGAGSDSDWLSEGFNPGKRALNVFYEGAANGALPAGSAPAWLNRDFTLEKRCVNTMDESCSNGGVPGAGSDKDWLGEGFNPGKRCANIMDESCGNGGIPGSGSDKDWLDGGFNPGKRRVGGTAGSDKYRLRGVFNPVKRCANIMDESCDNGGIPGSGSDKDFLDDGYTPGKRSVNGAEGVPGSGSDNEWLNGDNTPGKR